MIQKLNSFIPIRTANKDVFTEIKDLRQLFIKKINKVLIQIFYFEANPQEIQSLGFDLSGYLINFDNKLYCIDESNGYLWKFIEEDDKIIDRKLCNFNYPTDNIFSSTRIGIISDFIEKEIELGDLFLEKIGESKTELTDEQIFKNFEKILIMFDNDSTFDNYKFGPSKYICNTNSGTLLERFLYNELTKEERENFEEQLVYPKQYESNEDFIKSDNIFKFSFVHTNNEKITAFLKEFNQRIWDDSFQEDFVCDTKWLFVYYMCCKNFGIESSLLLKFKIDYLMLPNWVNDSEIFISIQDIQNYFNMIFEILQEDNSLLRYKKMYALISNFEREYKFIKKYHMEERCGVSGVCGDEDECK